MIVGIGHVKRVGKDVAATALSRELGFQRRAFADKLKDLALLTDPLVTTQIQATNIGAGRGRLSWVVQGMGWDEAKAVYPEVRRFLQEVGVGARKTFGEDFWVKQAVAGMKKTDNVVFSDVRFQNEIDAVHAAGGKVIRIDRPGHVAEDHVSETALSGFDGWDAVIVNDGTVQELEAKVVDTVKGWLAEKPTRSAKRVEALNGAELPEGDEDDG